MVGVRRTGQLTPKALKLYKTAQNLKNIARRLYFEKDNAVQRIKKAKEFSQFEEFLKTRLNRTTINFLTSQLKMQRKKPKGRRFTIENKILSLALMKQSPRGHKLLRKLFALPSRKTLMAILNNIPFNCGVNEHMFKVLEVAVQSMKNINKYCILTFDEMSVCQYLRCPIL